MHNSERFGGIIELDNGIELALHGDIGKPYYPFSFALHAYAKEQLGLTGPYALEILRT